jgi:transposase
MTIKKCEISCWSLGLLPIFAYAGKRQKIACEAGQRARRWVVERTHSWLNRFRRILVRWEKKAENYIALLHFACALIALRAAGLFG